MHPIVPVSPLTIQPPQDRYQPVKRRRFRLLRDRHGRETNGGVNPPLQENKLPHYRTDVEEVPAADHDFPTGRSET